MQCLWRIEAISAPASTANALNLTANASRTMEPVLLCAGAKTAATKSTPRTEQKPWGHSNPTLSQAWTPSEDSVLARKQSATKNTALATRTE